MKKKKLLQAALLGSAIVVIILIGILQISTFFVNNRNLAENSYQEVAFQGEYSIEGSSFLPITEDTVFDMERGKTIVVRGHFSAQIPNLATVAFRVRHLNVQIKRQEQVLLQFGEAGSCPKFMKTPGKATVTFATNQIDIGDQIVIEAQTVYDTDNNYNMNLLLNKVSVSQNNGLYQELLRQNGMFLLVGALGLALSLALWAFGLSTQFNHLDGKKFLSLGLFTLLSSLWFLVESNKMFAGLILMNIPLLNSVGYIALLFIPSVIFLCIGQYTTIKTPQRITQVGCAITTATAVLGLILQLSGVYDFYEMLNGIIFMCVFCAVVCFSALIYEAHKVRSTNAIAMLVTAGILLVGWVSDIVNDFVHFADQNYGFRVGIFIFIFVRCIFLAVMFAKNNRQARKVAEAEQNIAQSKSSLLLSQMQPQVLCDALSSIEQWIDVDPQKAKHAIDGFSFYLRTNIGQVKDDDRISFVTELQHINTYIELEKMNLGATANFVLDVKTTDFRVPTLTIQPIVENAVKHGIAAKAGGGTVWLTVKENEDNILIEVCDNGVGFDVLQVLQDGTEVSLTGLKSIEYRLQTIANGSLQVESMVGRGTRVVAILPKDKAKEVVE